MKRIFVITIVLLLFATACTSGVQEEVVSTVEIVVGEETTLDTQTTTVRTNGTTSAKTTVATTAKTHLPVAKTSKSTVTSTVTTIEVSKETKKTVVLPKQVFKVEKITRVTFYGFGGAGQGVNVPSENMKEIVNWLGTFSVGEKVPEFPPPPPGTGEIVVEIVYADGTIVKQPLQLVEVSGVRYYTKCGDEPACYREILSRIKPLRSVTP